MPMTHDLNGRIAVVTGAAGDIGVACALRLAKGGATVALSDLSARAAELERTAEHCRDAGAEEVLAVPFDVTDEDGVVAAVMTFTDELGPPSLLVNAAGYQGLFEPAHRYPPGDTVRVMAINVTGLMTVTRAVTAATIDAGVDGVVVNVASMAGVGGAANMPAYSASKAAVIGYTKAAARDLAPHGIRVNAVSPAFIGPGEMWDRQVESQARTSSQYYGDDSAIVSQQMIDQVPLRRLGSPDEVASVVTWLASDEASYITGETVLVTGGIV